MTTNLYHKSPNLPPNNLHPFNGFPPSGPLSPPSEGGSPNTPLSGWAKGSTRSVNMETSPHSGHSPILPDLQTQDPYLSVSSDPEELDFQASAIRLTPVGGSPNYSSSFSNGANETDTLSTGPTIQTNYWAPQGNGYQDISASASPHAGGFLAPSDIDLRASHWQDGRSSFNTDSLAPQVQQQQQQQQQQTWTTPMPDASQWLNQEQTIPSPSSMQDHHAMQRSASMQGSLSSPGADYRSTRLTVSTENMPGADLPSASTARGRSPMRSPIGITVSSVSRGDSPVDEGLGHSRRPSRSSMHLSPGDMSDDSEDDSHLDDDHRSISSLSVARTNDGKWIRSPTGYAGLEPSSRGNEFVPSPNDLKDQRERDMKNQDISLWSADVSAANSEAGDEEPPSLSLKTGRRNRLRARSTGDHPLQSEDYFSLGLYGKGLAPGPGLLVYESEGEEEEGDDDDASVESGDSQSDTPPADANEVGRYDRSTPEIYTSLEVVDSEENFRLRPWQDPVQHLTQRTEPMQPDSSTAAMVAFEKRAKDIETASLAATIDNNSIINVASNFEKMSITGETKSKESISSLWRRRAFFPSSSKLKRQASDLSTTSANPNAQQPSLEAPPPQRSHSHRHRLSLSTRHHARSPSLTSALMSMTGQMAAIGGNNAVHAVSPNAEVSPKGNPIKARGRSRSELPRPAAAPGLMDLMSQYGGPLVAGFRSPRNSTEAEQRQPSVVPDVDTSGVKDEDDDDDHVDAVDDKGLVMEFPPVSRPPIPTYDGFKSQIMQLNPRLEPALVHRFATEQVRRYKKLVDLQQKHANAIASHKCKSGQYCFALGGKATLLEQRKTSASAETGQTQFRVTDTSHDQTYGGAEGSFTPAQFPAGVPIPPVSRLPAQFECSICYEVKKFQKPSDWSKHVQEDVHPFTCSFPECNEVRSFKRKADWVRHENELHRHLEWWTCNYAECSHTCYRKDNFVQHLVREHKLPDPKVKKGKGGTAEGQGDSRRERDLAHLLRLLDDCRHETDRTAQSEPCRFCGNILGNWKKLTVHLGKHMEQLAMPVLELAKQGIASSRQAPLTGAGSGVAETYPPPSAPFHAQDAAGASALTLPPRPPHSSNLNASPTNHHVPYDMSQIGYTSISDAVLSSEPEAMAESFDPSEYHAGYNLGPYDQATLHPSSVQTHLPHQMNSVTYPPPFNAVHSRLSSYSQLHQDSALYPAQGSYPGYQPVPSNPSSYTSNQFPNNYSQM